MIHTSDYISTVTGRVFWRQALGEHPRGMLYTLPVREVMVSTLHAAAIATAQSLMPDGFHFSPERREIYYPAGRVVPRPHTWFTIALRTTLRVLADGLEPHEYAAREWMGAQRFEISAHDNPDGKLCETSGVRVTLGYLWRDDPIHGERPYPCPRGCSSADVLLVVGVPAVTA